MHAIKYILCCLQMQLPLLLVVVGPVEADPEYQLIVDSNNMAVEIDNETSMPVMYMYTYMYMQVPLSYVRILAS